VIFLPVPSELAQTTKGLAKCLRIFKAVESLELNPVHLFSKPVGSLRRRIALQQGAHDFAHGGIVRPLVSETLPLKIAAEGSIVPVE
jgi:hypothetical protein